MCVCVTERWLYEHVRHEHACIEMMRVREISIRKSPCSQCKTANTVRDDREGEREGGSEEGM